MTDKQFHNVNGVMPSTTAVVEAASNLDIAVSFHVARAVPRTAMACLISYTPNRDAEILTALKATGWAFRHVPIAHAGTRGVFTILSHL